MFKRYLLVILLFTYSISASSQFDTTYIKSNIKKCADSMMHAFKNRNWDTFTLYSYPALVGSMGGVSGFTEYIRQSFGKVPDSAWKKYEPGRILQVVKAGKDYQCVIELNSILEWQGYRVSSTAYLVGESWDGGSFWTFFDGQGDPVACKQMNANLSNELIIPKTIEKQEPLPVKNKKKSS